MRDYAIVRPQFWTGRTGKRIRALGVEAQLVALYLQTCPSANMAGLYYLPIPVLAYEAGMPLEGASKALHSLSEVDFAHYDDEHEVVWVPEMARYQIGDALRPNDNRVKGVLAVAAESRKSRYFAAFLERYWDVYCFDSITEREKFGLNLRRPREGPSKGPRSQDQDQDQDQIPPIRTRGSKDVGQGDAESTGWSKVPAWERRATDRGETLGEEQRKELAEFTAGVERELAVELELEPEQEIAVSKHVERLGVAVAVEQVVAGCRAEEAKRGAMPGLNFMCRVLINARKRRATVKASAVDLAVERARDECPEWAQVLEHLRERVRADLVERWFVTMRGKRVGDELVVYDVPRFVVDNYADYLRDAVLQTVGLPLRLADAAQEGHA